MFDPFWLLFCSRTRQKWRCFWRNPLAQQQVRCVFFSSRLLLQWGWKNGVSNDGEVLFVWLSVEKRLNLKSLLLLSVEKHSNPCYYTHFLFVPGFIPFQSGTIFTTNGSCLGVIRFSLMKSQRFDQLTSQIRGLNVDFYGCLLGDVLIHPPETPITPLKTCMEPENCPLEPENTPLGKGETSTNHQFLQFHDSFQECNHVGEKHFSKL